MKASAKKNDKAPEAWRNRITGHDVVDASTLVANDKNWREHPDSQVKALSAVIDRVGWVQNVIVNQTTGRIVDGHLRVQLATARGEKLPVTYVKLSEEEEMVVLTTFDPLGALAEQNTEALKSLLAQVDQNGNLVALLFNANSELLGSELLVNRTTVGNLSDRFMIPPFSVFNAREGWWQDRKRAWIALGIKSELGRGGGASDGSGTSNIAGPKFLSRSEKAAPGGSARPACDYSKKQRGDGRGRPLK